jgi:hypothetical protein
MKTNSVPDVPFPRNRGDFIAMALGFILPIVFALSLPGCASTGAKSSPANQASLELAIGVASDAAALVLQKNPKAVPALRATSAGIGVVLTQATLTPEQVKAFVDKLGQDADLSPAERLVIGRAVQRVHGILVVYFATPNLNIADPRVRSALEKVKQSIDDTLALYEVLKT